MPMTALAGWLTGAQWKEYPLPADFASGLHTQLLSNTFCDPRHAGTLLTVHGGTLDLGGFAIKSAPHEASAAAAVHAAAEVEVLTEVVGLGPYMLQSEDVRAELRCSDTLTKIGLAPLGTGVKGPTDIGQPYRTTEYINPAWESLTELLEQSFDTTLRLHELALGPQRLSPTEAALIGRALRDSTVELLDISGCLHTSLGVPPNQASGPSTYGMPRGGDAPPAFPSVQDDARTAQIIAALSPMLRCSHLVELQASRCQLGDAGMVLLCQSLRAARALAKLNVALNCFQAQGADALALLVHQCGTLRHLDLSGNQLTMSPTLALAALTDAIGESRLVTVDWDAVWPERSAAVLKSHPRRAQWALQLARAVTLNKTIVNLSLAGQPLGASGRCAPGSDAETREVRVGAELSVALRSHWKLEWLCLYGCALHDAALGPIVGSIHDHPALRHLDLSHNTFGRKAAT